MMTTLRIRVLTMGVRSLSATALFAHRYPRATLTMLAGVVVLGPVALISALVWMLP
jgi:hypothetical protein